MTSNGQSFRDERDVCRDERRLGRVAAAIPLLLTMATGVGLWLRHTRGSGAATTLAWYRRRVLLAFSASAPRRSAC